jgi:hypothetical protein
LYLQNYGGAKQMENYKQGRKRRKQSSGMWDRVDMVLTDVSEERIASIFRVEGKL